MLTTIGSDFIWVDERGFDFGVKAKAFDFKERNDTAEYIGGTAVWHPEEMSQIGLEAGISEGDDARDEFILTRIYGYWEEIPFDLPLSFLTADFMFVDYGNEINNEDNSLFFSVGGGMRFLDDALMLKLSADYSSDPFYKEDYRSTLMVTYQFKKVNEDEE